ncbi:MAG TPA: hypothetical protein VF175_16180 [Lacipirellula sp.]
MSDSLNNGGRRKLVIAAMICGLAASGVVGGYAWRRWAANQELQRIAAAGEPITPHDLAVFTKVPDGHADATAAWQKPIQRLASGALRPFPRNVRLLDKSGMLEPPGEAWHDYDEAKALVDRHALLYQDIDAAVNTPGKCAFLDDFSSGYMTLLDHAQQLRMIQRLLIMRAYVQQRMNDTEGAYDSIWGVFKTGEALRREPFLVSQLIRLAIHRSGLEALQHLLPHAAWTDEQLLALHNMLLDLKYKRGLERALMGERAAGLTAFADPSTAGAPQMPGIVYQAWIRDDPLQQMTLLREFIEAASHDWPAPLELTAKFSSQTDQPSDVQAPLGGRWEVPSGIAGDARKQVELTAIAAARARAAAAGIAVLRFRRAEGRWPEDLADLVPGWLPALPLDPCTGSSLRFANDSEGVRVYSVGINGKDDGGVETPENLNGDLHLTGKPDVVFSAQAE